MEIVKFKNGYYAIRKNTLFSYKYKSRWSNYWWPLKHAMDYCAVPNLKEAQEILNISINDYGNPV